VYDDGTVETVTDGATWTSSDPTVAGVAPTGTSAGVATPIAAGSTTITASYQGVSGSTLLTVSGAKLQSIAITPSPLSLAVGAHQQLTATGTWDDKSTRNITGNVTWISTAEAIGTVSNAAGSRGLFTAVSPGSVMVEAAVFPVGPQGTLTVTVTAAP
jgi:cysteine synthase